MDCTRFPSEGTATANTAGGTLVFVTDIPEQEFLDRYGLLSANVDFIQTVTETTTIVTGSLDVNPGSDPITFTITKTPEGVVLSPFPPGSPLSVVTEECNDIGFCSFVIRYTDAQTGTTLTYSLSLSSLNNLSVVNGSVCISDIEAGKITLPVIEPTVIPDVSGDVWLSTDKKMICQVTYTVKSGPDCRTGLVSAEKTSTVYGVNLQCVMKGSGCTIRDRFDSLVAKGWNLDWTLFIQYSILRIILSSLLFKKCFSVELLTRKYKDAFQAVLENTKSKYYDWFFGENSLVSTYWMYFK
jgi:hypothetical protein